MPEQYVTGRRSARIGPGDPLHTGRGVVAADEDTHGAVVEIARPHLAGSSVSVAGAEGPRGP